MTAGPAVTPRSWQVHGLSLAGLEWGAGNAAPLLALHGWLDNAASFSVLGPLLARQGFHVVAPDLPGHGLSDWRSPDAGYQIWEDLPEIRAVADHLGWEHFSLLGHSRGAIISALFASAFPERVGHLVLLDALFPAPVEEREFPAQLRRYVDGKRRWLGHEGRVFDSPEAALRSRTESGGSDAALAAIVRRNLVSRPRGCAWGTDPRLRGASAVKLSSGHIEAMLGALSMPTLLLLAEAGLAGRAEMTELARRHIRQLELERFAGGHHFHLEPAAPALAERIARFTATAAAVTA